MKKPPRPAAKPEKRVLKRVSISLEPDVHQGIKDLAAELGVSMSAVVRCILSLFLLKLKETHPKMILPGKTPAECRKRWAPDIIPELGKRWERSFKKRK